jgi:hypothetical protein
MFQASQVKESFQDPHLKEKKLMCACHPSYSRKHKIGGSSSRLAWQTGRTYLQNKQSKKGWRHDSSNLASMKP